MAFLGILQRTPTGRNYRIASDAARRSVRSFVTASFAAFMNMTLGLTWGLLLGKRSKKDKNRC